MNRIAPTRRLDAFQLLRLLLLVLAFALPVASMRVKSITGDEVAHISAGFSYLTTGEIILNPMHPPLVKELCGLPLLFLGASMPVDARTIEQQGRNDITYQWYFGQRFFANPAIERLVFWARIPAVLLSVGLALVIAAWARELWGTAGSVLALALYVFDPSITAHAQLVTTDVAAAFFSTLYLYLLRKQLRAPAAARLVACGLVLGLALGAKFSTVLLLPLTIFLTCVAVAWRGREKAAPTLLAATASFLAMCLIAYLVLWVIYLFPSDPAFYLHGLRTVRGDDDPRHLNLLMGRFSHRPFPSYLLIAWLVKTPLPTLLILGGAMILFCFPQKRAADVEEVFVIIPAIGFFIGYSLLANPIGVRYLIPAFPFLYIFAARILQETAARGRATVLAIGGLLAWLIVEFTAIWPDHLSYFNQIAGGARGGVAWLDDSNVDWGQGLIQLRNYLRDQPGSDYRLCYLGAIDPRLYGIDGQSVWIDQLVKPLQPGRWIVSSHCLARTRAWLTEQYGNGPENWTAHVTPTAFVGHAYWVFDIVGAGEDVGRSPALDGPMIPSR